MMNLKILLFKIIIQISRPQIKHCLKGMVITFNKKILLIPL